LAAPTEGLGHQHEQWLLQLRLCWPQWCIWPWLPKRWAPHTQLCVLFTPSRVPTYSLKRHSNALFKSAAWLTEITERRSNVNADDCTSDFQTTWRTVCLLFLSTPITRKARLRLYFQMRLMDFCIFVASTIPNEIDKRYRFNVYITQ
jgi:hypothetical protein